MLAKRYTYVGPPNIRQSAMSTPSGTEIHSEVELSAWLRENSSEVDSAGYVVATFVVDVEGILRLAPRRSEHIACASGGPVLSAGEITFSSVGDVVEISNQSTGFCPEPESWQAVEAALEHVSPNFPSDFTTKVIFRLCPKCKERNVVKDSWFICELCGANLPELWNFPNAYPSV